MGKYMRYIKRRYVTLLIAALFSAAVLCFVATGGCKRYGNSTRQPELKHNGQLSWRYVSKNGMKIDIRGYLFPRSVGLEKQYHEQRDFYIEKIQHYERKVREATDAEWQKTYEETAQLYREELETCTPSWDHWPYIVITKLFLEGAKPSKVIAVCRYERVEVDLAFTLFSKADLSNRDSFEAIRSVAIFLESLPSEEWAKLPVESKVMFDEDGEFVTDKFDLFMKGTVFVEQR